MNSIAVDAGRLSFAAAKMGAEIIPGLLESIRKEATSERREYGNGKRSVFATGVKVGKSIKPRKKSVGTDPIGGVQLTKELTDQLRRNRTVDWDRRESARAHMRMLVKRLLKKYKYPPDETKGALETVMRQCELWVDETAGECGRNRPL